VEAAGLEGSGYTFGKIKLLLGGKDALTYHVFPDGASHDIFEATVQVGFIAEKDSFQRIQIPVFGQVCVDVSDDLADNIITGGLAWIGGLNVLT
jgi:hypothetical protein